MTKKEFLKDDHGLYTLKIDYPIVDFGMMGSVVLNGEEKDLGHLKKWSFILEVGHEPRIEMECRPDQI